MYIPLHVNILIMGLKRLFLLLNKRIKIEGWDVTRIDKCLTLIGGMLVVLSLTMTTHYATTEVNYSFTIVHPSDSDIRYIGSDNPSGSNKQRKRIYLV